MKDIEYEKDGVKKIASERFKEELEEVGWTVVEKKRGRPKKEESEDE